MTGLEAAYAFETPAGIDFVKLPAVKKIGPAEPVNGNETVGFGI